MTSQPLKKSILATFLSTLRGKIIAALTIIALLLGIVAEGLSVLHSLQGFWGPPRSEVSAEEKRAECVARFRNQFQIEEMANPANPTTKIAEAQAARRLAEALAEGSCGPSQ